ncbi:outer membrane protein assembly factor BamC [Azohydromonas lata]|uniref:Outer membrane protein assembly factor BamC n=2 Tax=Azohydromonas lata TaxID=45677 RepID=A0ABU5IKX0_9BURK|nr:outer membrane protein assembly factor BamC [Azohydromonas lata]MDZ5459552.1 outer membrane protein assembly factor BamC [Azohydromonas lata]
MPEMNRLVVPSALVLALGLAGCSTMENALSGDKLDYRSQATKTAPLEIPPDLTQLARDQQRYQPQNGPVSAATYQQAAPAAGAAPTTAATPAAGGAATAGTGAVAPTQLGDMRIERAGNERWLVTSATPDQLWPQLVAFWQERGFNIAKDDAQAGVIETEWAENRAKLPQDFIRRSIGKIFDGAYSTSERDMFRTRVERTTRGTEITITHRGMEEVFVSQMRDQTKWTARPSDPGLEAEFLSRLMVKLGAKEEVARATVAQAPVQAPRARALDGQAAALQLDDSFDRAWRRVGVALDRSGFTVEDRDRTSGLYYVRYVDPKEAKREEPGFFSRLFGRDEKRAVTDRYRVAVKSEGNASTVSVQNAQGAPDGGEVAKRIVQALLDDLK